MDLHWLAYRMLTNFRMYVDWIHLQIYGCPFVFDEVHFRIIQALQDYADGIYPTRNIAINVFPGCVSGDTIVHINRGGKGKKYTVAQLYHMFNGGVSSGKVWDKTIPTYTRKLVGKSIGLHEIKGVYYTGIKPVYRLTLEDGKSIKCTADHQIMTNHGFVRLDELNIGDMVMIDNLKKSGTENHVKHFKDKDFSCGVFHPHARKHHKSQRISLHRAIYEANLNGMTLEEFRRATYDPISGPLLKTVPVDMEVHHIDHNHNNNTLENLQVCTRSEHSKLHKCESNFGQGIPEYVAVVSIEYIGQEKVYDIDTGVNWQTEGNFSANQIIVHNCGKTTLMQYWISWCFARCRSSMFLYISAVEDIAKELSAGTRDIMLQPKWQQAYGVEIDNSKLSGSQASKKRWQLKSGGQNSGLIARTMSSSLLGLSAGNPNADGFPGCLAVDDPQGFEIVSQPYAREQTIAIYKGAAESRRRGNKIGTVLIQQRLHINDLTGYLKRTEPENWTFISVPALIQREDGSYKSTCERVMGVEELLKMKEQDPYKFYALYQQEPIQSGGTFYHDSDFQYYQSVPQMQQTFIATDFAFKKEQNADRTVFMHLGLGIDNNVYLLNYIAFRDDVIGVRSRFIDFFFECRKKDPYLTTIIVEKSVANMALIPTIVAEHPYMNFVEFSKAGMNNKIQYIKAAREFFLGKRVFFPEEPKPVDLINETLLFSADGSAEHDDMIDCLSQGLHWIFGNMQQNSIFI